MATVCLHISAHGDADGLLFGGDEVSWVDLLDILQPVLTDCYQGPRILVFSACHADQQALTATITSRVKTDPTLVPPRYIFCSTGTVGWSDAAVGWTLFYHLLPKADLEDKTQVQGILTTLRAIELSEVVYFRWDNKQHKYMKFEAKNQVAK
jgi:hypothetical protein